MNKTKWRTLVVFIAACTVGLAAQQPPGSKTGNPTPGTPQPEMPNLADRLTFTGCVQPSVEQTSGRPGAPIDSNSPSDSRFVLMNAARTSAVSPGAGTSTAAAGAASRTYRLKAIDSLLSPFVGTKVVVSGAILPSSSGAEATSGQTPTLQVEFVQKISQCSG